MIVVQTTFFQQPSLKRRAARSVSEEEIGRMGTMFRQRLGRDLSPEEQRYLGLSLIAVSSGELEFAQFEFNELAHDKRRRDLARKND